MENWLIDLHKHWFPEKKPIQIHKLILLHGIQSAQNMVMYAFKQLEENRQIILESIKTTRENNINEK